MSDTPSCNRVLRFDQALLPSGWARDVCVSIDARGDIVAVESGESGSREGIHIPVEGSIVLKSGHSNSASLRGQAAICILFDEFAHFMTSTGKQSGDEVYNALVPSVKQFGVDGKVVLLCIFLHFQNNRRESGKVCSDNDL